MAKKLIPKRMCAATGCRVIFRPKHKQHWFHAPKCRQTAYRDRLIGFPTHYIEGTRP